ncbi:MAG: glycosyltransferase family 9 protein [Alphaproteobacteria bacterium]
MAQPARILVIKHSAFGDFILSTGSFRAIRAHHAGDRITLLTTEPFRALAEACPFFDAVWIDPRPGWTQPWRWLAIVRRLRAARFDRVYDLQRNDRTAAYFRLLWPRRPEWVGTVAGCSHRYVKPADRKLHIVEREVAQLAPAGVDAAPAPALDWLDAAPPLAAERMVLLVPGSAPHRPEKRWPAAAYGRLAKDLAASGYVPVLIGAAAEADARAMILAVCPQAVDLGGRTGIAEIAALARRAVAAVGNDTGPMHVIAGVGCPTVSLFGDASDPALIGPRGPRVHVLRHAPLPELAVARVRRRAGLRRSPVEVGRRLGLSAGIAERLRAAAGGGRVRLRA